MVLSPGVSKLSVSGQIVNILGFLDHNGRSLLHIFLFVLQLFQNVKAHS